MNRKRIHPPYKVAAVLADGTRVPVDAHELVIEVRPGIEVEIDLAPHPGFAGQLTLMTPPPAHMKRLYDEGTIDEFSVFFGATNVLHVIVERRLATGGARRVRSGAAPVEAERPKERSSTRARRGSPKRPS